MAGRMMRVAGWIAAALALLSGCARAEPAVGDRNFTVVIDAGHGGYDHGTSGTRTGVPEDKLNLQVAKKLELALENAGFTVVMTRESDEIQYDPHSGLSRKTQDMRQRAAIIESAQPGVVISIHMNKFPDGRYGGPQVFYHRGSEQGKLLAESVQKQFNAHIEDSDREALSSSSYFILKASSAPSILVECGFLSNERDEMRLQTESFQQQLADLILAGLLDWLEGNQPDASN
ncbi:MAG: N-acetylmuramoyl-L-alanine amidase family protein [Christensenellales bacterium]